MLDLFSLEPRQEIELAADLVLALFVLFSAYMLCDARGAYKPRVLLNCAICGGIWILFVATCFYVNFREDFDSFPERTIPLGIIALLIPFALCSLALFIARRSATGVADWAIDIGAARGGHSGVGQRFAVGPYVIAMQPHAILMARPFNKRRSGGAIFVWLLCFALLAAITPSEGWIARRFWHETFLRASITLAPFLGFTLGFIVQSRRLRPLIWVSGNVVCRGNKELCERNHAKIRTRPIDPGSADAHEIFLQIDDGQTLTEIVLMSLSNPRDARRIADIANRFLSGKAQDQVWPPPPNMSAQASAEI